jgi:hypothetical protein
MKYKKIINPADLGYTNSTISQWRSIVKWQRNGVCEECGKPDVACHLHECIVTRQDARGLPDERRIRIFSNCNMALLCDACHRKAHGEKDSREKWWAIRCQQYGEKAMREWYAGFQWKAPERRFMPDEREKQTQTTDYPIGRRPPGLGFENVENVGSA